MINKKYIMPPGPGKGTFFRVSYRVHIKAAEYRFSSIPLHDDALALSLLLTMREKIYTLIGRN